MSHKTRLLFSEMSKEDVDVCEEAGVCISEMLPVPPLSHRQAEIVELALAVGVDPIWTVGSRIGISNSRAVEQLDRAVGILADEYGDSWAFLALTNSNRYTKERIEKLRKYHLPHYKRRKEKANEP